MKSAIFYFVLIYSTLITLENPESDIEDIEFIRKYKIDLVDRSFIICRFIEKKLFLIKFKLNQDMEEKYIRSFLNSDSLTLEQIKEINIPSPVSKILFTLNLRFKESDPMMFTLQGCTIIQYLMSFCEKINFFLEKNNEKIDPSKFFSELFENNAKDKIEEFITYGQQKIPIIFDHINCSFDSDMFKMYYNIFKTFFYKNDADKKLFTFSVNGNYSPHNRCLCYDLHDDRVILYPRFCNSNRYVYYECSILLENLSLGNISNLNIDETEKKYGLEYESVKNIMKNVSYSNIIHRLVISLMKGRNGYLFKIGDFDWNFQENIEKHDKILKNILYGRIYSDEPVNRCLNNIKWCWTSAYDNLCGRKKDEGYTIFKDVVLGISKNNIKNDNKYINTFIIVIGAPDYLEKIRSGARINFINKFPEAFYLMDTEISKYIENICADINEKFLLKYSRVIFDIKLQNLFGSLRNKIKDDELFNNCCLFAILKILIKALFLSRLNKDEPLEFLDIAHTYRRITLFVFNELLTKDFFKERFKSLNLKHEKLILKAVREVYQIPEDNKNRSY